jgi:hypothetical protein
MRGIARIQMESRKTKTPEKAPLKALYAENAK